MPKTISTKHLFIILAFIVVLLHLLFYKNFWNYGFGISEDWIWLAHFNSFPGDLLSKFIDAWKWKGIHKGTMVIYVGMIDRLFPSNYLMIQIVSFIGKITASVLLFPATLALTKNRTLAFLSSIFFAISYASAGSFITSTNSMEYWGLCCLSIFVIYYVKLLRPDRKLNLADFLITALFLFLSLQFTFVRLFGMQFIIIVVEIILIVTKKSTINKSTPRLLTFLAIFFIFNLIGHDGMSTSTGVSGIINNLAKHISDGDLAMLIHTLASLSLTLVPQKYTDLLSVVGSAQSLSSYKFFIKDVVLKFFPTLFITLLLTDIILPVKKIRFFLTSLGINIFLLHIIYLFGSHYTEPRFYLIPQAVFGSLILTLSFTLGVEWYFNNRNNNLLFIGFASSFVSFYLIFLTWLTNFGKNALIVYAPLDKYLPVPQIGICVFLASLFTMSLQKIKSQENKDVFLKFISVVTLGLLFLFIAVSSYDELQYYKIRKSSGVDLKVQESIQADIYHTHIKNKGDRVIYYITPSENDVFDAEQGLLIDAINDWEYSWWTYGDKKDELGCTMALTRSWHQEEAIYKKDNRIRFRYNSRCPAPQNSQSQLTFRDQVMTMPIDNLFAFTVKSGKVVDMTDQVKKQLQKNIGLLPTD